MSSDSTKIILITGASSGIGMATAQLLAKAPYSLILCGRRKEKLQQLKSELERHVPVHTLCFDVSDYKDVEKAFQELPEDFKNIDVLVNNAGNAHGLDSLLEGNVEDWDQMIDGNVKGLLYVSRMVIPGMARRSCGHVINISSVAALQTYAGGVVYCASKKAVDVISEGMRLELTSLGIKVSNIRPGAVETDFSIVRFKGDEFRASQVYQGFTPLNANDIADAIRYCIEAPAHVSVSEMTLYPTAQSEARTIHKKL